MKSINKILMKAKLKHYKNIKRESKSKIWTTKTPKYMANTSFDRLKFETIDLLTNCWVGGHILNWWQSLSSCLNKTSLLTSEFKQIVLMQVLENYLSFPTKKKNQCIWSSRTWDMGWTLNSVWAAWQIPTSPLLLRFGLSNSRIESLTPHECFRPMS
jgi:hypothetical protein